jgi:N-acetylmuramoyl-L-alanine amidase
MITRKMAQMRRSLMKTGIRILAVMLLAGPCLAQSVQVSYSDGRPVESIAVLQHDDVVYLSVSQISRLLGLEKTADLATDEVTLRSGSHTFKLLIGGTVWMLDGETVAPGDVAFREGDEFFVELGAVEKTLAPGLGTMLRWDEAGGTLFVGLPAPSIIDIDVRSSRERVTATIKTIGMLNYELLPAVDGKIEILVKGGVFSTRLGFDSEGGLIESIRAKQETHGTRIIVSLGDGDPGYRVFPRFDPRGIVVLVWKRTLTDIPDPEFRPPRTLAWADRFSPARVPIDLIVIDPGHGGDNLGSVGPSGYMEKDFNLEISRKLRDALERKGIDAMLTRNDDVFVDLVTRTEVANSVGADLFISMHANGYGDPAAGGFEIYFLSPAMDDHARTVAAMENAGSGIVPVSVDDAGEEIAFILWDTAQNEFIVESSHLAQLIDEELAGDLKIKNRGVKQATFVVLAGVYLPAVLVESAFITNPREEELLADDAFQDTIVNGIVEAVLRFKQHYGR